VVVEAGRKLKNYHTELNVSVGDQKVEQDAA
jgi:hypothetical protein